MVDFRKMLLVLAALTLMFTTVASAQLPYSCNATAVPTLVRSEGIAELTGDILLSCSGAVPAAGIQANIRVRLNTNITSNVLAPFQEGILLLDELTPSNRRGYTAFNPTVYQATKIPSSDTEVEFLGVTLAGPGSAGAQTIRITNVRANASALGSSATIFATVNITGSTTVPVDNNSLVVADTRPGMKFTVDTESYRNCEVPEDTFTLNFQEGFASAFRPVGDADVNNTTAGGAYANESGFNPTPLDSGTLTSLSSIGQASRGTRLWARFSSVPSGATLTAPYQVTTGVGLLVATAVTGYSSDGTGGTLATSGTVTVTTGALYEVTSVTLLSLATQETVVIPVTVSYSIPGPLGSAMVKGNFAPISTVFTASSSAYEPRFVDSASDTGAFDISPCRTILLFPFISNQAGFDTGLAISNTSRDPLGTTEQNGACSLYFYGNVDGGPSPTAPVVTGSVAAGTSWVAVLSDVVPGFQGYMFAICAYQFAHGYAFISDENAALLAQGYLALVVPDRADGRMPVDSAYSPAENEGEGLGN